MQQPPLPEDVFAPFADQPGSAWLDCVWRGRRWTVLLWDPSDVTMAPAGWTRWGRSAARTTHDDRDLPFVAGVAGYLGYAAGNDLDPLQARPSQREPDVFLGRYDGALLFDHTAQRWTATGGRQLPRHAPAPRAAPSPASPVSTWSQRGYERAVVEAIAAIEAGEVYQINLTRAVHAATPAPAWSAFRRLQAHARAPYLAWLCPTAATRVLSSSPELFLALDGDALWSAPIKGTRPRGSSAAEDHDLAHALTVDPKERAELAMIVDLVRNDLGRVAVPGSVQVRARAIAPLPNVFHASQEVHARLSPGRDVWDALAAASPPGSVTGCPKIRATAWIDRLEPEPRGAYCGSIGFVSDHGPAVWSVAIRTAVYHDDGARWQVGSGIVADSDPTAEWHETVAKGRLLARAIAGLDDT